MDEAAVARTANEIEEETDLRAAVQYAVLQICNEEDKRAGNTTSPQAIASLAEIAYLFATQSMAPDIDAYSNHAGRRTVNDSDVKLILRKNANGLAKLENFCEEYCSSSCSSDGAKRKAKRRTENAVTIDLQRNKAKDSVHEASSEDSSSDDDLSAQLELAAATTSRIAALPKPALHDSLLDDSDDEVQVLDTRPPLKRPPAAGTLEDTSDDDNGKPKPKATVSIPNKRFRLGLQIENSKKDAILDSSDDDDDLDGPVSKTSSGPTKNDAEESRVLSIMANMSMDSILSDDANKENGVD